MKERIHFSKPDKGPLSDFDQYAPDMVRLFAQGLEDNKKLVSAAFNDVFSMPAVASDAVTSGIVAAGTGETFAVSRSATAATQAQQINLILDNTVIGRALLPYIRAEEVRVGIDLAGVM